MARDKVGEGEKATNLWSKRPRPRCSKEHGTAVPSTCTH